MRTTHLTPRASTHLDMLRGLAALVVVLGHVRGLFFVDFGALDSATRGPMLGLLYGATSLGHEAVMVFFVLSGFFIGGSVLSAADRWSWKSYLVNRLTRLYVVLIPALLLTLVVDLMAHRLPAGPVFYEHAIPHFNEEPFVNAMTSQTFLGNLVFLQTIVVRPFGSNGPLWSLANEFWYYSLFPLLALLVVGRIGNWHRTGCAVAAVGLCIWLPWPLLMAFAIWLFGVAIHGLPTIDPSRRPALAWSVASLAALALVGVLGLAKLHMLGAVSGDFVVGLAAAAVVYAIAKIKWSLAPLPTMYTRIATASSKCSYSVYAVHFPVVLLIRVLAGTSVFLPTVVTLGLGAALVAGIWLFGFAFSRVTEAHTDALRRRIMRWIDRKPEPIVAVVRGVSR